MIDKPRYGSLEDIDIGLISGRQPIRDTDSDISTGHLIVKVRHFTRVTISAKHIFGLAFIGRFIAPYGMVHSMVVVLG